MKPIDPNRLYEYVDKTELDDKGLPKPEATVWPLRPLTKRRRARIQDMAATVSQTGDDEDPEQLISIATGRTSFWRVKYSLTEPTNFPGWETETDPTDPNAPEVPTDAFLDTIPDDVFQRMSATVSDISTMETRDAEKPSPSPTSSTTTD